MPATPATRRPIAGARQRAHADVRGEIVAAASRQLGTVGAAGLSLRAIARELGMVSSALYRYFASRDDLLTALIIEAYDDLGAVAERSIARSRSDAPLARWVEAASAIRRWALDHPQEYALLYGSPVPGYAAPADTIVPGTRVTRALIQIVHDALTDGLVVPSAEPFAASIAPSIEVSAATADAFEFLRGELDLLAATDAVLLTALAAWTQLFGHLSFELFGQTHGLIVDHEAFFRETSTLMGARIGLP
ncbi:MAG: TetR/AcrR family transcriptional regulator [Ilumatobacteraceae bacterium]